MRDTDDQDTLYIYGSTAGTPASMVFSTGHLLRAVVYPDSSNAGTTLANIDSDSSDVVSYAYNAQGEVIATKDQAGNIITTAFDTGGRETSRTVTTLIGGPPAFDGAVRGIATVYDSRGMVSTVTQYDDVGVDPTEQAAASGMRSARSPGNRTRFAAWAPARVVRSHGSSQGLVSTSTPGDRGEIARQRDAGYNTRTRA